ncbi:MAG TPA: DUF4129 domain-containing protein [Candidatus Angelobacter sp.]|nr:DUF4129 domain-containing protein [Candidatus Angelobacter sp.]
MTRRHIAGTAALLGLMLLCCAPHARAGDLSVSEYRQQTKDIAAKVDALQSHPEAAGELVTSIPDQVSVFTHGGAVTVNNKTLKDSLTTFVGANEQKRPGILREIQTYAQAMSRAADAFDSNSNDLAAERGRLVQILARHEFNKVKGPNAKDALLTRIFQWISKILSKLAFRGAANFDLMRLLIYLFVGAAVTLLLVWTIRRLRRPREEFLPREIIPFSPSARGWRTWLAEARALAQQQDWRNAIHLSYWAGIAYLEEHGAWKPNRARTPREYLRLIGTRAAQYPVLSALTRKLETVWYGYGNASEADYQEALGQLEKLGCR